VQIQTSSEVDPQEVYLRALKSFSAFCALLEIVDIETGKRRPMELTWIQRRYNAKRTNRDIILKPRKVFMTTLEIARDLWWFLTRRGARVVIVCQSEKGNAARNTVRSMLRVALESLRRLMPIGSVALDHKRFDVETNDILEWHERDASLRIMEAGAAERTAAKGGRSQTVNRLHVTEAAYFEHGAVTLNSLLNAMPPIGGEVVIESTPNGASGYYYEQWKAAERGTSGFTPHFFTWWSHPGYRKALAPSEHIVPNDAREEKLLADGVSPESLKWYREKVATLGHQRTLQEFPSDPVTCFLSGGRHFFDAARVAEMVAKAVSPPITQIIRASGVQQQLINNREVPALRVWHEPVKGNEYIVSVDTSEGSGGNAGAACVIERVTGQHIATLWGQFKPWELASWSCRLAKKYFGAWIAVERNNHGHTVLRCLVAEQKYARVFRDRDGKPGWNTTPASRPAMLDTFEKAVRAGHFETNDVFLLAQMNTFDVGDKGKAEARKGTDDDLVMATGIGWDVVCRVGRRRSEVEEYVP
jgi:hypothetical protein